MTTDLRRVESADGVEVALYHFGGSGPPLLICHATGFNGGTYEPFAQRLLDHFDVWALDMRGHGATATLGSGDPVADMAWKGMGLDVIAAVDEIGGPVLGFGHSMGGAAIVHAEQQQPGSFTAAYMFEPIILPDGVAIPPSSNSMGAMARRRRPEFESKAAVLERYGSKPPLGDLDPEALAAYVQHGFVDTSSGTVTLACTPENEALTFESPDKPDVSDARALGIPLMMAAGKVVGPMSPAHFSIAVADGVEQASLVTHDDMSHFGPLENPQRIADDIVSWQLGR